MEDKTLQRKRIVDIAQELFSSHGYSKVSMDDIASKIGISKKTLYTQFKGKEDLLNEAINQYKTDISKFVDNVLKHKKTPSIDKASEIFSYIGTKISSINPYLLEDVYKNAPSAWANIQEIKKDAAFRRFKLFLEDGMRQGYIRKDINRSLAVVLYACAIETIINPEFTRMIPKEMMHEIPFSTAAIFDGLVQIIFEGVMTRQ